MTVLASGAIGAIIGSAVTMVIMALMQVSRDDKE